MEKKIKINIHKHWYLYSSIGILLVAAFLRFYNLFSRISLGGDGARDILVVHQALLLHHLPLVGPFSSAGPFVTGPMYYWFLMLDAVLLPHVLISPWIFIGVLGTITVFLMMYVGLLISGRQLAIILGILAAVSPQWVTWSIVLTNPTFVMFLTPLVLIFFLLFYKTKKIIYAVATGFTIGLALNMHYQALNLIIFFIFLLFVPAMPWIKRCFALLGSVGGFLVALLPFLWWDSQQGFANIRNVLDYFLIGEYRIYVPNSWKIFLFTSLSHYWQIVVSGNLIIAYVLMVLVICYGILLLVHKKENRALKFLFIIFVLLLIANRYYRGERGENYLLYLSPFILLFSALTINYFIHYLIASKSHQRLAMSTLSIIICILSATSIASLLPIITTKSDQFSTMINTAANIEKKYPGKSFQLYDYQSKFSNVSQGLSVILAYDNKEQANGVPIGMTCQTCVSNTNKLIENVSGDALVTLDKNDLKTNKWSKMNQADVYNKLIGWLEDHNLRSTFDLQKYIQSKISSNT